MNYITLFETVEREFSKDVATLVVVAHSLHLSEPILNDDFLNVKDAPYGKRVKEKIEDVLWSHRDYYDVVLRINSIIGDYEMINAMSGHGACEKVTLRELFNSSIKKDKETGKKYDGYYG